MNWCTYGAFCNLKHAYGFNVALRDTWTESLAAHLRVHFKSDFSRIYTPTKFQSTAFAQDKKLHISSSLLISSAWGSSFEAMSRLEQWGIDSTSVHQTIATKHPKLSKDKLARRQKLDFQKTAYSLIFSKTYAFSNAVVPIVDRWLKMRVPSKTPYSALYVALDILRELSSEILPCVKFVYLKALANGWPTARRL